MILFPDYVATVEGTRFTVKPNAECFPSTEDRSDYNGWNTYFETAIQNCGEDENCWGFTHIQGMDDENGTRFYPCWVFDGWESPPYTTIFYSAHSILYYGIQILLPINYVLLEIFDKMAG